MPLPSQKVHWGLLMFLEEPLDPPPGVRPISKLTAHLYSRRLTSILYALKVSYDPTWIRLYRRALLRQGALAEIEQAEPMTREVFRRWVASKEPFVQAQLLLLWKTASRLSDFDEVVAQDLVPRENMEWGLCFRHSKGDHRNSVSQSLVVK